MWIHALGCGGNEAAIGFRTLRGVREAIDEPKTGANSFQGDVHIGPAPIRGQGCMVRMLDLCFRLCVT
jgi:hypothetical protein